jgi:hypothetical protein
MESARLSDGSSLVSKLDADDAGSSAESNCTMIGARNSAWSGVNEPCNGVDYGGSEASATAPRHGVVRVVSSAIKVSGNVASPCLLESTAITCATERASPSLP